MNKDNNSRTADADLSLLAYCGLYCGACSFKAAAAENNRKHLSNIPAKYDYLKNMELIECPGCRNDNRCGDCKIKSCAVEKKIAYCGECNEYPCQLIKNFASDGIEHHENILKNIDKIRKIGIEQWLLEEKSIYKCGCGNLLSWYSKDCIHND